ncbi:hypothetical protein LVB87_14660 [Lysobacter sp. KIS68-7]|uniref:hypothetical protein n=1 Tax=Lysobacter sp. KIS68-7 TaxID=2904252 RepID=UPI001E38A8C1|nr:hypothetical protein [Lysobacter sp. KIS68-7]UHQ19409.1 hypothetical protein LVB87_14660 [Lysobacter sp. KIS68-7]
MLTRRLTLLGLALAMAAGTAVAANPAPAAATGKAPAKEKQTCVKHNKMGHCEKWAPKSEKSEKTDSAAKAKEGQK